MSLAQFFLEGGWVMYPIALLGMLAIPATLALLIVGLVRKKSELLFAAILGALGVVALGLGVTGHLLGMRMVEAALAVADPSEIETMRAVGTAESRTPLIFAAMIAIAPLAAAAAFGGLARVRSATNGSPLAVWLAPLALGAGTFALGFGFIRYESGAAMTERAIAVGDPDEVAAISAAGAEEIGRSKWIALAGLASLAVGGAFVLRGGAKD